MPKVTDVKFEYEEGGHHTMVNTSGNPGNTTFNQYWIKVVLADGTILQINLKKDFSDIFSDKRITEKRRGQIQTIVESQKKQLIGIDAKIQIREYAISRSENWQNHSQSYDNFPYYGLDDSSLAAFRKVLADSFSQMFS